MQRTPREHLDAQHAERQRTYRALMSELVEASVERESWYLWILCRRDGIHSHELRDSAGRPVACPVHGCRAVEGTRPRQASRTSPAVLDHEGPGVQLGLLAGVT